jgi:hypothetical protein
MIETPWPPLSTTVRKSRLFMQSAKATSAAVLASLSAGAGDELLGAFPVVDALSPMLAMARDLALPQLEAAIVGPIPMPTPSKTVRRVIRLRLLSA